MKHEPFNESVEMYLKTASELATGDGPVPISALADRLGVSAVSATEMVHRLCDQGLLDHVPYKGVTLTAVGDRRAYRVIRRHRLWEHFLADHLGLAWQEVHDFACQMEHATPDEVVEGLAEFLGQPATCPHGNPIPGPDGEMPVVNDAPLSGWETGDQGVITRLHPESLLLLDYAASQNIRPGQAVACEGTAPFRGPMLMKIGGESHMLGREVAAHIYGIRENA
jgi:DtxR family transcriptional regulator, Mn-dependent transcriptional regulator